MEETNPPNQEDITGNSILFHTLMEHAKLIGNLEGQLEMLTLRVKQLEERPANSVGDTTNIVGTDMEEFPCPKVTFSRMVDKRLKMELWLTLGNGELSRYPHVTYVGEVEKVLEFLDTVPVIGLDTSDLPAEFDVSWTVTFKWGRYTGRENEAGEKTRYKDLVAIEEREE